MITIASIIFPFSITGLTTAPVPDPLSETIISGVEKYSDPWLTTAAFSSFPFTIIGFISAFLPLFILTLGLIGVLSVVDP